MEKFITLLYRIKNKVDEVDVEFRYNFDKSDSKCNPFVSNPNKTYVWVEKLKKNNIVD